MSENEREEERKKEREREIARMREYCMWVCVRVCVHVRDISDLILIFIFSTKSEKVFLVNVYKKGRRKYFMAVIVNCMIDIILILYYYCTIRFPFFFFFLSHQGLKLSCDEKRESFYRMYLLGIYDLLI